MNTLFKPTAEHHIPLAQQLRPNKLEDVVGQDDILGESGILKLLINAKKIPSIILWGPPGCGKTTIARLIANEINYDFVAVSAITSGVSEQKKIFANIENSLSNKSKTLLFVDEIHRFNRAQQDIFLPFIEQGTVALIGATTENPSFELNSALLSRCKVVILHPLGKKALAELVNRAEEYYSRKINLTSEALDRLYKLADGDGRYLLGLCEEIFALPSDKILGIDDISKIVQKKLPIYDKNQDGHYGLISALHKSLRGSDADAALYWFSRMLDAGEDPLYIARRLVRFAVEDIGLADPDAVVQANSAKDAFHFLGSPEGELALAQAVIYLATAPKSNAAYVAYKLSRKSAKENPAQPPPKHILNAPTKLMKDLGYGDDYQYDHNEEGGFSGQDYFPENMAREQYYTPVERGFERQILKRLDYWNKLRDKKNPNNS